MQVVLQQSFHSSELAHINRIRIHQQVLYLSDVMAVNGKSIDDKYWQLREENEQWSSYNWPRVYLTEADLD